MVTNGLFSIRNRYSLETILIKIKASYRQKNTNNTLVTNTLYKRKPIKTALFKRLKYFNISLYNN